MSKKKVIILIDGQNLYYTLKDLKLLERDVKWGDLFNDAIDSENYELIRTYWFRAAKLLDTYYTEENIKRSLCHKLHRSHSQNFNNKLLDSIPKAVLSDINEKCEAISTWIRKAKFNFNQLEYAYDQLSLEYEDIEIVKKGVIKIDPFEQKYVGEKGVDIALAVKMISLSVEKKCDKIILVSGDYDYAEAINYVKDNMMKIHIVKIHKGYPPRNKSMSRDLSVLADKVIDLYESDIRDKYIKEVVN